MAKARLTAYDIYSFINYVLEKEVKITQKELLSRLTNAADQIAEYEHLNYKLSSVLKAIKEASKVD